MSNLSCPDRDTHRPDRNANHAACQSPPNESPWDNLHTASSMSDCVSHQTRLTSPNLSWPPEQTHDLGLLSLSITEADLTGGSSATIQAANVPNSWSSDPTIAGLATFNDDNLRNYTWDDSCDPLWTIFPNAPWGSSQQFSSFGLSRQHISPMRPEYSSSTRASCVSSPYANSDGLLRMTGSPLIKLEEPTNFVHYVPERQPFDQSMLVSPDDVFAIPVSSSQHSVLGASFPASNPGIPDAKPSKHTARPAHRNTSSEDVRSVLRENRQKRSFTRPENASCCCEQCGKLFQRSYNLKAHLLTHDAHRSQPYVCQHKDCEKRFVRRTDVLRHEQSVHIKARNYPCPLCQSSFARKDTLRRHVEDGCPKRPEVKKRISKKL